MILRRVGPVAASVLLMPVVPGVLAASPVAAHGQLPGPADRCVVSDSRLDELSGLASDGESWFATNDGGTSLDVYVLDPDDCSVRDVRTAATDPYDVEDLALGPGGSVWLADTGDNKRQRDSIALHVLSPGGGSVLHRLTYPDGPHDAEALLLDHAGVPYIITKEPFGAAGVYRPTGSLAPDSTVALERVTTLLLNNTDSPGGPMSGNIGSRLVTGASTSQDGTVVAVRTYTEAYLFHAADADVVAALQRKPLRVPLPHEPQGEAIALEPEGTLLSASEGTSPVRAVPGAAAAARAVVPEPADQAPPPVGTPDGQGDREPASSAPQLREPDPMPLGQALIVAAGFTALIMLIGGVLHLRRRRR